MKKTRYELAITLMIISFLFVIGCQQSCPCNSENLRARNLSSFGIADVQMVALSKITTPVEGKNSRLKLLVEIFDKHSNRIKTPLVIRIELYEFQKGVPQNIGKRLKIWPDIDLTDSDANTKSWNDFLRCYEFEIDTGFVADKNTPFVIMLTCFGPNSEHLIKYLTLTAS